MKNVALILASGTGTRFGLDYPKQFVQIGDKCILQYTVERFQCNNNIDEIIVVTNPQYVDKIKDMTSMYSKVTDVIAGGETRKDSSYNGIMRIGYDECNVLIHDGVRPLVSNKIINDCIEALVRKKAVCVAIDSTDTIYVTTADGEIVDVPKRNTLKRAQTPQCFRLSLIKKAHELAKNDESCKVTDDCGLVMFYGLEKVYSVDGDISNIKITYPDDIEFARKNLNF